MKLLTLTTLLLTLFIAPSFAESVFRIEVGNDYKSYSHSDLQRRVWELERAVWQLQQRVFQLESKPVAPTPPTSDSWICIVEARNKPYTGTGGSKAVAKARAMEACKGSGDSNDGFFCGQPKCEQ